MILRRTVPTLCRRGLSVNLVAPVRGCATSSSTPNQKEGLGSKLPKRLFEAILGASMGYMAFKTGQFALEWPDACQHIVDQAATHPMLKEKLGLPIKGSFLWTGSVKPTACCVTIPISGPLGSATLEGRSMRYHDSSPWTIATLQCVIPPYPQKLDILLPEMQQPQRPRKKPAPSPAPVEGKTA